MYSFLSFQYSTSIILLLINTFLINLPLSFCADDPNYLACSQPFECGNITNISYPFWKSGREDCGHPAFKLECQDDDDPAEIQFESKNYRVLEIDRNGRKLRLVTTVSWTGNCPSTDHNISFPSNAFSYLDSSSVHITLFYGCSFIPSLLLLNKFSCNNTNENCYRVDSVGVPTPPGLIPSCNASVTVNALRTIVDQVTRGSELNLENVLDDGFDVVYDVNTTFCDKCAASGGACGYNWTSIQPKCFCYDGPRDGTCPTLPPASKYHF